MRTPVGGFKWLGPEFNLFPYLLITDGGKCDDAIVPYPISDGDIGYDIFTIDNNGVDDEAPLAFRRIGGVEFGKIFRAANAFTRLRPVEGVFFVQ